MWLKQVIEASDPSSLELSRYSSPALRRASFCLLRELSIDRRQCRRETLDVADDGVAAAPEQRRKVALRGRIDGDAEDYRPEPARFLNSFAGVLDREVSFVMVDVVWLAIGEDEQELLTLR